MIGDDVQTGKDTVASSLVVLVDQNIQFLGDIYLTSINCCQHHNIKESENGRACNYFFNAIISRSQVNYLVIAR